MNAALLACPYCNAAVTVAPGTAAGQRVSCPRCGDAFTLLQPVAAEMPAAQSGNGAPALPPADLGSLVLPPRRSNARVLAVILGVMGCMAAVGLGFALLTQGERRANDKGIAQKTRRAPQPEAEAPIPALAAPDKLEALGYLPPDVGVLVGVHVADLLAVPAGRQLLQEPIQVGGIKMKVAQWAEWMGLRLEDIDHLVAGVKVEKGVLGLRMHAVARTRELIDPEQLRAHLHGQRPSVAGKKGVFTYVASWGGVPFPLAVYCPDNCTVVIALGDVQRESVPAKPVADLAQFREEIRTVLRERREPGSQFWVAGYVENWQKTPLHPMLQKMPKEDRQRLTQVRSFGMWVQLDDGAALKASFHCQDAARARALDELFHAPERAKLNLKTAVDGPWVSVQLRTDLAAIQHALGP
jgi:hypothetical protein